MKKLALLLGALLAQTAYAVDAEVAVGIAKYKAMPNGFWYQEGLPYSLDLRSAGIQVGAAGKINSWLDWHAGYAHLGRVSSDAIATPLDSNYSKETKSCIGECIARSRFRGYGNVQGIYLTLEPHVDINGWRFGVSAGPFLYVAQWKMRVDDWIPAVGYPPSTLNVSHKAKINFGAVIGASISRGNWTLQYQRFFDKPRSDEPNGDYPPIWQHTDMLSVRYRF